MNLHLALRTVHPNSGPARAAVPAGAAPPTAAGTRLILIHASGPVDTPVNRRDGLRPGHAIDSPVMIEQMDAAVVVGPRDRVTVRASGTLQMDLGH